jgi:membrane protease YdiL (CAAX protease family)
MQPPSRVPSIVLLVTVIIAIAALAAPVVHRITLDLGLLQANDFLRVFRRIAMIGLAIVFGWAWRPWRDGGLASYGFSAQGTAIRKTAAMFLLTAGAVAAILALHFAAGHLRWREEIDWSAAALRAGRFLVSGLVIAAIEELFFRGWMQRRFSRSFSPMMAATICSAIYAFVHSFRPKNLSDQVSHDWVGVMTALGAWLTEVIEFGRVGPPMFGLFLFGMLLALVTRIQRSIMPAIGIHAGAVFVLYAYGSLTTRLTGPAWAGTKSIYDGAPAWLFLLVVLLLLHPRVPADDTLAQTAATEPGV